MQGNTGTTFLANAYAEFCAADEDLRERVVKSCVRNWFVTSKNIPEEYEDAKPDLLPVVRSRSHFEHTGQFLENGEPVTWPREVLGEHFGIGLVYDLPESMMFSGQCILGAEVMGTGYAHTVSGHLRAYFEPIRYAHTSPRRECASSDPSCAYLEPMTNAHPLTRRVPIPRTHDVCASSDRHLTRMPLTGPWYTLIRHPATSSTAGCKPLAHDPKPPGTVANPNNGN